MTTEIADQRKVLITGHTGQRPVVMNAGDGLHAATIAVPESHAIDAFGTAHIRRAIASDRNRLVGRKPTWHRRNPKHFIAGVAQRTVGELVNLRQFVETGVNAGVCARDQLELRLAVIGRDLRVRERGAKRNRMRCQRETARGQRAQAFLFNAAANALELRRGKGAEALLQAAHVEFFFAVRKRAGLKVSTLLRRYGDVVSETQPQKIISYGFILKASSNKGLKLI